MRDKHIDLLLQYSYIILESHTASGLIRYIHLPIMHNKIDKRLRGYIYIYIYIYINMYMYMKMGRQAGGR
jgi:hypothetical protein